VQRPYLGPVIGRTPTGRRSMGAACCSQRTWIRTIRGNSRTCLWA